MSLLYQSDFAMGFFYLDPSKKSKPIDRNTLDELVAVILDYADLCVKHTHLSLRDTSRCAETDNGQIIIYT